MGVGNEAEARERAKRVKVRTEWTGKGRLPHPSSVDLRTDKDPEDGMRERPVEES